MAAADSKQIRVRFAPSPTGPFHVGGVRTALFNWLFARQNSGVFVLRIEDTDISRSEKKYEDEIFDGLKWAGLDWDEGPVAGAREKNKKSGIKNYIGNYGPYRQSERIDIYKNYLQKLIGEDRAYYCYCTKEELEAERQAMLAQGLPPKYGGHCRSLKSPPAEKKPQVIRFKTSEAQVKFKDMIRGEVVFNAALFGDLAIAKNLESPLYNFAAVVDDEKMEISHVIRGEEHLSNTPKQILLQKALGFNEPEYAHLPLILNPDRSKMSKRFADTALASYREEGYLPEAIVNFLAFLGWHPKDNREIFGPAELVKEFDLKRVQKAGAVFNQEKLDWLQKEHMKNITAEEMSDKIMEILKKRGVAAKRDFLKKIIELERPRLKTLNEFPNLAGFFFKLPDYESSLLIWQKEPAKKIKGVLNDIAKIFDKETGGYNKDALLSSLSPLMEKAGRGAVLWPLRVALSGQGTSPDPLDIALILGPKEVGRRINLAIKKLEQLS